LSSATLHITKAADFAGLLAWRSCCWQPSRIGARFSNKRFAAVVCLLLVPPYSRAAATASLASTTALRLPVFPSTKSAVIV